MWEGEPVGVDPKRPLVGFALVAVLCAVLMTLSVGQGWGADIFRPGKPIAVPVEAVRVAPAQEQPREPETVSIPDELSAQPLGVAVPEPLAKRVARATAHTKSPAPSVQAPPTQAQPDEPDDAASSARDRQADRAAERAERKAHKAALKALRSTEKAARKAQREADKAAARAQHEAEKAARKAQRDAEKAARDAEKAAEQAVRDAAKLARDAAKAGR
jgi:hypothetical protein